MTPEKAYEETLRRIREAEKTGALELDLRLSALKRFPQGLEQLTSLQSLNLSMCERLTDDLSSLAGLTSLQSLDLSMCEQLCGDLSPLAGLVSLQSLNLSRCCELSDDLTPLASLTSLQKLDLSGVSISK